MANSTVVGQAPSYRLTTTVEVGRGPHAHVAFSASTNTVWVLNGTDRTVTILDAATSEPTGSVDLGGSPGHIIIDDRRGQAFLPLEEDELVVVSLATGEVSNRVALPEASRPTVLVPQQDLGRLYVLNDNGTLSRVDLASLDVVSTVEVGANPSWGQPHKTSFGKMHVTNSGSDSVSVIADATGDVVATVAVGAGPNRNAVYRERRAIYTANLGDYTLTGISIVDDAVIGTAQLGVDPFRLVPADKKTGRPEIWVLGRGDSTSHGGIEVVDSTTHEVSHRLETVDHPANWLFEGSIGHVVGTSDGTLMVFDTRSLEVTSSMSIEHDPDLDCASNMVMNKAGQIFLVNADDTVSLLTPTS